MKYKALLIDFDGTTIKNGQYARPTPRVINAIQKAKEKLLVCGATGRPMSTAKWIFDDLHLISPSIISAGTKIVNPTSGDILWQIMMKKDTVAAVLKVAEKYPFEIITESQLTTFPWQKKRLLQDESVIYIVEVPLENSKKIISELAQIPNTALHLVKGYGLNHLDIHMTDSNGTKEKAIEKLCEIIHVTKQEIIGVGDSFNDLPLFNSVGLKVAMGNAVDELKEKADYITGHVNNDGLAQAIEKFILNPS
ncbi:MAG TPA: HAD family hydrolase [Patescibacteria group bacterium]|nr:HAD family hydrolase [Patescibacteria group bacterium]